MADVLRILEDTAIGILLLLVVYVPLERAFPARKQRFFRREFVTDIGFLLGSYLLFTGLVTLALRHVAIISHAQLGDAPWRQALATLPIWVLLPVSLMLGDLAIYWFHRACHHYEFLWRFHRVHHTTVDLDWLAAHREHPLDGLCTQFFLNLPAIVIGLPFHAIGGVIVFRGIWAIFIHSNVALPLGPLRVLFGAPDLHHWHHANVEKTAHNFANLAPYWDVLFGTYHRPPSPETYPLGVPDGQPESYVKHLVRPLTGPAARVWGMRLQRGARNSVAASSSGAGRSQVAEAARTVADH